ncbi:MAG TPA: Gfo/Idh/MocA family oxidoreductase [Terracidiphilus sp.]|jgi:predicted dehydrogenase|nr:Gfo/Idh/MocA family oxidoreductase [Terracidiphilus sp.]
MIRVGLIGFGLAGRVFHAPLISSVEGFELAAVLERTSDEAAKRYPGIRVYRELDAMLADPSLDLVVVASPSGTHFEIARQVIRAGKHLVVDKPVAPRSAEIAELANLARERGVLLIPFHNRRWDGDVLTVRKLVEEGVLGRLVHVESNMERWAPGAARRPWKNDPAEGGGVLLDLGTHLADLALALFGLPLGVGAEVERERDGKGANDSFTIRLRYPEMRVTLGSNLLSSPPGPRFVLRGTRGNFLKSGVDPQEAALRQVTRIESPQWGKELPSEWGMLHVDVDGAIVSRPVETQPGDYRKFYEGVREAIERGAEPPVKPEHAWRAARVLEWAEESARERREISCEWPL